MSRNVTGALAVFGLGVALMLILDSTWARITGVACLLAGIVLGAFAIATPGFIGDLDDASERPHAE